MSTGNRQWLLRARPVGKVGPEHFELVTSPMPQAQMDAGQVLVKVLMLSFDPAMRMWLEDEPSYLPPVAIGEAIDAIAQWVNAGEIAWREDIQEGFENIPTTLQRLFDGRNVGKQLLKLADPQ